MTAGNSSAISAICKVVGVPPELLATVGEDAEDLDELALHLRRGIMEHAKLNLAQAVVECEELRLEAPDQDVKDQSRRLA